MAIDLTALCRLRPYLYHLTARANLPRIARLRRLDSAAALLVQARRQELLRQRRRAKCEVAIEDEVVLIRDQAPLHQGNMLLDGMTFEDFVAHLNSHVFFWPGREHGPIPHGVRHYERYADETPGILRARTSEILSANPTAAPSFCRFNSGSPRWNRGRPSPRSANTFSSATTADFREGAIIEVTFSESVTLPQQAEVADSPYGPWRAF